MRKPAIALGGDLADIRHGAGTDGDDGIRPLHRFRRHGKHSLVRVKLCVPVIKAGDSNGELFAELIFHERAEPFTRPQDRCGVGQDHHGGGRGLSDGAQGLLHGGQNFEMRGC